jgi:D-galactarolactone isomerase
MWRWSFWITRRPISRRSSGQTPMPDAGPAQWDCAIHVYDARAAQDTAALTPGPAWATVEAYKTVQRSIGTSRTVVVQPTAYGFDNTVTLAAVATLGPDRARAVVVIDESIAAADLRRMHEAGARGARFQMLPGGRLGWEKLTPVAARIADLGWHIQLQMDGRLLHERERELSALPCPIVIDHIGKFLEPVPAEHPGIRSLRRLLGGGRCWLKLSAPYEVSRSGAPDYADVGAIAKLAIGDRPDRLLWGSNWPHVACLRDPPDDGALRRLLTDWAGDQQIERAIMSESPDRLYGQS